MAAIRATYLRRHAEIAAKLQSLRVELDAWRKLTDEQPALKRHQSQIRLLDAMLSGLLEPVAAAVKQKPVEATVLDDGVEWESEILAAHSIWEVFRSKYVLRQNELFRDYLAACDDLAWECYAPALKKLAPAGTVKAPPLVFLSSTWSPFAQSRDTNFQNEVRVTTEARQALRGDGFQEVLQRLPIPLVSLPWYQAFHLPGAILVAHEIGHIVERDFDLSESIRAALAQAGLAAPDVWSGWASELFADAYGCIALGPAFGGALIDLLATSTAIVESEQRRGGEHPTRALRVELMLLTLESQGFLDDAQRLRAAWDATYTPPGAMADLRKDVPKVVKALLAGPYGGAALADLIPRSAAPAIDKVALLAATGLQPILEALNPDPRTLIAAAQRLHEDPTRSDNAAAFAMLKREMTRKGADQYRHAGEVIEEKTELDAALAPQEEAARAQGRALRNFLATLAAASPTRADAPPGRQGP